MNNYLIAFDLLDRSPDEYQYFWVALTALHAKALTDSVCLVQTDTLASELTADLSGHLGKNDRLLVVRLASGDWGSKKLMNPLTELGTPETLQ